MDRITADNPVRPSAQKDARSIRVHGAPITPGTAREVLPCKARALRRSPPGRRSESTARRGRGTPRPGQRVTHQSGEPAAAVA
jgi:hypothetical protein